jgi:hypothetical protein
MIFLANRQIWTEPTSSEVVRGVAIMCHNCMDAWFGLAPLRHHHLLQYMRDHAVSGATLPQSHQGFWVGWPRHGALAGRFVDRVTAMEIALVAGQIDKPKKMLFSEDVW